MNLEAIVKYNKLVSRRHPEYKKKKEHWKFLEETYEGGRAWFDENIFRYIREGDREYKDRVDRAYRFNHTREVVDLVNKHLFKMKIQRKEDAKDYIKRFWKNSTLHGLTVDNFIKDVSKYCSIFGRIWVVVDTTNTIKHASVQDEKDGGVRAYAYFVKPEDVLDLSYDDAQELNWILIRELARNDDDPLNSDGNIVERYRLWTRDSWTTITVNGRLNSSELMGLAHNYTIPEAVTEAQVIAMSANKQYKNVEVDGPHRHEFGKVPVFHADNVISDNLYTSPSMIDDVAYLDRAVANYLSNLDAIIQDQSFSQLVIPAQGLEKGSDVKDKLLEMGTKRIFTYDGDSTTPPHFISPDVKQAHLILAAINKIIAEIYHTVGLSGERTKDDNGQGIDNSSGVAKAYDFERVNSMLVAKADSLEYVENKLVEFVSRWYGDDIDTTDKFVTYPDDFDVRSLTDEFGIAARLNLIEAPDSIRRHQMTKIVEKLFPQIEEKERKRILKDLENWSSSLSANAQQQQGNVQPSNAPNSNKGIIAKEGKNSLANKLVAQDA